MGKASKEETQSARIIVDKSESRCGIPDLLDQYIDINTEIEELSTGDYQVADDVLIERKEVDDLINSLLHGRLFEQLTRMRTACTKSILLIEGNLQRRRSKVDDEQLRGLFARLTLHDDIHIIQTRHVEDSAATIRRLALHAQGLAGSEPRLRGPKPDVAQAEVYARYLIEGLPEIGPRRVKQLLEQFGTPLGIFLAGPEQIATIIGRAAAQKAWTALNVMPYGHPASWPPLLAHLQHYIKTGDLPAVAIQDQPAAYEPTITNPASNALFEQWLDITQPNSTYRGHVSAFLTWYFRAKQKPLQTAAITNELIDEYFAVANDAQKTGVRQWCQWLHAEQHINQNPIVRKSRKSI